MPATYDISTPLGQVRLLCTDKDITLPIFEDDELDFFLTLNEGSIRLAAAQALDTIASTEVLLEKKMRTLDTESDGTAVAKSLQALAAELRRQENEGDGNADGLLDVAETVNDVFGLRELLIKRYLRANI